MVINLVKFSSYMTNQVHLYANCLSVKEAKNVDLLHTIHIIKGKVKKLKSNLSQLENNQKYTGQFCAQ